jgi:uncharacterized lipoprotein YddW (UPF0748 family)
MLSTVVASLVLGQAADQPPQASREFRAAWVATVDNIDWPSEPGLSVSQQRAELLEIMETAEELNLNAIIFQIRPHADALYASDLEPWSYYLTGEQGKAPEPFWDPLEFAIDEAHARGIELHAWFNPYRALHPAQDGPPHESSVVVQRPDLAPEYGSYRWMDPGNPEVQDRSFEVFMDVVERYDLDGIHIDDYFYPYPVRDEDNGGLLDFPDEPSYAKYLADGGTLGRADWRRASVDNFVKRVYEGTKERKPWVKFGISPFGIYRPGVPEGIEAGIDQYDQLYADALKWLQEGWADYYTPQLYWPIDQEPQSYPVLLNWWTSVNSMNRHIWPGNFTSRLNPEGGDWPAQEVVDQILLTRRNPQASGNVHFSFKTFTRNWKDVNEEIRQLNETKALVPASPWLDDQAPNAPSVQANVGENRLELATDAEDARFWAIYVKRGDDWTLERVTSSKQDSAWVLLSGASAAAVSVVDKYGNEGPRTIVSLAQQLN